MAMKLKLKVIHMSASFDMIPSKTTLILLSISMTFSMKAKALRGIFIYYF